MRHCSVAVRDEASAGWSESHDQGLTGGECEEGKARVAAANEGHRQTEGPYSPIGLLCA